MDRSRRLFLSVALCASAVSIAACTSPAADRAVSEAAGPLSSTADEGAAEVLDRLGSARSASVRQRLSLVVPDDVGASTYFELTARIDRDTDRLEGTLDSWVDEGEESTMSTWPDDLPTDSTARIVGGVVHMRFGDDDRGDPWRDVTALDDVPPVVAHLRSVEALVELLVDAAATRPPSAVESGGAAATTAWQGSVPPELLVDLWTSPGPIGAVVRTTSGMPADPIDDVHVYEIVDRGDGTFSVSLWLDVERLAANVGEPVPAVVPVIRLDAIWSELDRPVVVDDAP